MTASRLQPFGFGVGLAACWALSAHAALLGRGGGMVFDTDRNSTWLANANLGAGSAYDDGFSSTDGAMSWQSAVNRAANLSYGGYDDWRLPATPVPDETCATPQPAFGISCTGSELGHLYVTELAGTALLVTGLLAVARRARRRLTS